MKIKIWRTSRAWRWYCPACDRTWSNHHRPRHIRLERLSPSDPRRVPAFQRTIAAVDRHLWRYHGGPNTPGRCAVRMERGPFHGQYVHLRVPHPTMMERLHVPIGDWVNIYHLAYTRERVWVYLYDPTAAYPMPNRETAQ